MAEHLQSYDIDTEELANALRELADEIESKSVTGVKELNMTTNAEAVEEVRNVLRLEYISDRRDLTTQLPERLFRQAWDKVDSNDE